VGFIVRLLSWSRTSARVPVGRSLRTYWVPISLIIIAVTYVSVVTLAHTLATSPIDEWVYIDYLTKIPTQGIVYKGEFVDSFVLNILACHGTSPFGPIGTPCGAPPVLADFPNGGVSTADPYTPIYFYVTGAFGFILQTIFGTELLTSWRLSGNLWLSVSLVTFWLLLKKWNVANGIIFSFGLVLIASPFVWWTFSYVSTDAPSLFFGALLFLLVTKVVRSEISGWWFVGISAVATLTKITNVIGVAAAALFLICSFFWQRKQSKLRRSSDGVATHDSFLSGRLLLFAAAAIIGSVGVQVSWLALNRLWAVSDVSVDQSAAHAFTVEEFFVQLTSFLPGSITSGAIDQYTPGFVYAPLSWIAVASVLAACFFFLPRAKEFPLVVAVTISSFLAAPLLGLTLIVMTSSYFPLPPRYGGVLIPAMLLLGGIAIRARWVSFVFTGYATALLGVGIWLSFYLATLAP
jgi:hypothetical protein